MTYINDTIFSFLNGFALQYAWLDMLIIFFAEHVPYIVLGVVLLLFWHQRKEGVRAITALGMVLVSAGLAYLFADIIKDIVASPRPFLVASDVNLVFMHGGMDAYPSGHAAFFFALAFGLYWDYPRFAWWFLLVAFLISIARVTAGIHWPIDVGGGFLLGGVVAVLVHLIYSYMRKSARVKDNEHPHI